MPAPTTEPSSRSVTLPLAVFGGRGGRIGLPALAIDVTNERERHGRAPRGIE